MCSPIIAAVGLQIASGAYTAYQQKKEGDAEGEYYNYLSNQSATHGNLATQRGQQQSELIQDQAARQGKDLKAQGAQVSASQKAGIAASGIDSSSVTAQDIASDTFSKQKMDEMALRYNSDVASWETETGAKYEKYGYDSEAGQYSIAGKNARKAGKTRAFSTLLGTASSVAGSNLLKTASKKSTAYRSAWRR